MTAVYRGQELSLQELFSAFSHKLEEISVDPHKYVAWLDSLVDCFSHMPNRRFTKVQVDEVRVH